MPSLEKLAFIAAIIIAPSFASPRPAGLVSVLKRGTPHDCAQGGDYRGAYQDGAGTYIRSDSVRKSFRSKCWNDYFYVDSEEIKLPWEPTYQTVNCGKHDSTCFITHVECNQHCSSHSTQLSVEAGADLLIKGVFTAKGSVGRTSTDGTEVCYSGQVQTQCAWKTEGCHTVWTQQTMIRQKGYKRQRCNKGKGDYTDCMSDWTQDYPRQGLSYGCDSKCEDTNKCGNTNGKACAKNDLQQLKSFTGDGQQSSLASSQDSTSGKQGFSELKEASPHPKGKSQPQKESDSTNPVSGSNPGKTQEENGKPASDDQDGENPQKLDQTEDASGSEPENSKDPNSGTEGENSNDASPQDSEQRDTQTSDGGPNETDTMRDGSEPAKEDAMQNAESTTQSIEDGAMTPEREDNAEDSSTEYVENSAQSNGEVLDDFTPAANNEETDALPDESPDTTPAEDDPGSDTQEQSSFADGTQDTVGDTELAGDVTDVQDTGDASDGTSSDDVSASEDNASPDSMNNIDMADGSDSGDARSGSNDDVGNGGF